MNRTNIALLVALALVAGVWWMRRESGEARTAALAVRMFPSFNKEAADRIVIEGGWKKDTYALERLGSAWALASAGGYPADAEEARKFIDAVSNLRRENLVGDSEQLAKDTRTDAESGRLVSIFRGSEPMAEFRVGKNPERAWEHFFIRVEGESQVYRTRTILSEEFQTAGGGFGGGGGPYGSRGPRGFEWDGSVTSLSKWVDTKIWDLDDVEVEKLELVRPGELEVAIARKGEDKWELKEPGKEPVEADSSAVDDIKSRVAHLSFQEVVGAYEDEQARADYGLDKPTITLKLTLKKKIEEEKKDDEGEKNDGGGEKKDDGGEKKDGEGEKKKDEPEYITIRRIVEVGKKVKRFTRFDDTDGKAEEEEYYAIRVSGDQFDKKEEEDKVAYIFLVRDYTLQPLKKSLDDLAQKPEEKEDEEEEGDKEGEDGEKKGDDTPPAKKGDDTPPAKKGDDTPPAKKGDAPADPKKKDAPADPKKKDDPPADPKSDG